MREIIIQNRKGQTFTVLVDDRDYDKVAIFKWYVTIGNSGVMYARTSRGKKKGLSKAVRMHNYIMGASLIDHRNGNGLDNQRENLRISTNRENSLNTRHNRHLNTHGVNKLRDRYQSKISIKGKQIHLGTFLTEPEAIAAYQAAQRVEKALS